MAFKFLKKFFHHAAKHEKPPAPPPRPSLAEVDFGYDDKITEQDVLPKLQALLDKNGDPNGKIWTGHTALAAAAKRGWINAARLLLDHGADPNAADNSGHTVFMDAATGINVDLMKLLIERGADPQKCDGRGKNALYEYFLNRINYDEMKKPDYIERDTATFKFLRDELKLPMEEVLKCFIYSDHPHLAPLEPEVDDVMKFDNAVKNKDYAAVIARLSQGDLPELDKSYPETKGSKVLHTAAANNDVNMLRILLNTGINVDGGRGDDTPLLTAVHAGAKEATDFLIKKGARTDAEYTSDRYPDTSIFELADMCKQVPDMKAFVEQAIKNKGDPLPPEPEPEVTVNHRITLEKPIHFNKKPRSAPV